MKRIALFLATAAALGAGATSAPAGGLVAVGGLSSAGYVWSYGNGPVYSGGWAPLAYDSYALAHQYPVYTGRQVTAIAVEMSNSRFRHRPVVGPGVAYYRSHLPRPYRVHPNW